MTKAASTLLVDDRAGYQVWRLNRPARRNALDLSLLARVDEAREAAARAGVGVVVLTAAEGSGAFCAGFDLEDLRTLQDRLSSTGALPESPLHATLERLEDAPFTLITAINGAAVGGGCELALLGAVRFALPSALFLLPPSRLGVVYPEPGVERLRRALGPSLLRAMLVSAEGVPAERLERAGVLWATSPEPVARAEAMAIEMARLPLQARLANARLVDPPARPGG